jgi:hypothetical protein
MQHQAVDLRDFVQEFPRCLSGHQAVPSGIGVGVTMNWREVPRPFKSKYLLVGPGRAPLASDHVRLLAQERGQLYLNLDAQCEGE